jgi:flagellar biosynthesis/type III secretory pathway protein FliH
MMKLGNIKKIAAAAVFGTVALLGTSEVANAQTNRQIRQQERRIERQQRKLARQQQRYERMRYRVYRNGSYYTVDDRGADLLRQAVNSGYQQGYRAGRRDASGRSRYNYYNQSMYRTGTYGYQRYVDSSQYRYYFQQGFQRGYEDGYYSRNQYGSNGVNILGSILSSILNIRSY